VTINLTILGEHITTKKGYAFKSGWYTDHGCPLIKVSNFTEDSIDLSNLVCIPNNIAENYRDYKVIKNDVIIQTVGSWPNNPQSVVGKAIRVPMNASGALLNQNAVKLIPNKSLNNGFLFYLLRSGNFKEFIINTAQGAANQASITLDSIKRFPFTLPSLPTQRKIAAILSAYDDLIENNLKRIKILEEMAQNLYREWFLNFRFPGYESLKMVDSPVGMIPEGWEVKCLFDLAEVTYGFPFKSNLFTIEPIGEPIIRIRDLEKNQVNTYTTEKPPEKYQVINSDILIGMDGNFFICKWAGGNSLLNQRVVRLRTKREVSQYFLFLSLEKPIHYFDSTIAGTTVNHLGDSHLKSIKIVVPAKDLFQETNTIFDLIYNIEINLRVKNSNLRKTRDLILPKLISGEIDVSELAIKVREAE